MVNGRNRVQKRRFTDRTKLRIDRRCKRAASTLKERGYTIELVADGYTQSFDNSYGQHGLENIFDARTISEEVGEKNHHRQCLRRR